MYATRNGLPNVVLPSVRTETRGLALSSAVKYSVTCFQVGSLRSVPGSNPMMDAGFGIAAAAGRGSRSTTRGAVDCAPSVAAAPATRTAARKTANGKGVVRTPDIMLTGLTPRFGSECRAG